MSFIEDGYQDLQTRSLFEWIERLKGFERSVMFNDLNHWCLIAVQGPIVDQHPTCANCARFLSDLKLILPGILRTPDQRVIRMSCQAPLGIDILEQTQAKCPDL